MKNWDPNYLPYPSSLQVVKRAQNLSPPRILFWGFVAIIITGTLLLKTPWAHTNSLTWLESLFTATSAVTVTGLVVVDTGQHFTLFGHFVIALLIQIGGLGFVTFAILAATSVGVKFNISKMRVVQEAMGKTSLEQLVNTAKFVLFLAIVVEIVGVILLTLIWSSSMAVLDAFINAVFYTISAFNNAGFGLHSDSLTGYRSSAGINTVISALFIIGGLGFVVLHELKSQGSWFRFSVNTKLVLVVTLLINAFAFALIWLIEKNNDLTLAALPLSEQLWAAWFQAVTPRTAGFNTLPIESLENSTTLLMLFLMFIGGGSFSTAGGLKLGTFIVLIFATYHYLRQQRQIVIFSRSIKADAVYAALSLFVIYSFFITTGVFLLTLTEQASFIDILFETVSAIGTVGLSRGLTEQLSELGQIIIIFLMFVGRIGPLTFMYLLATTKQSHARYAETSIKVG